MIETKILLQQGKDRLTQNDIDISEARLLLAFVLNIETSLLATINECEDIVQMRYLECIEKRIEGIPYAYIVGKQEFMKLPFIVNSEVLIPRPDTEILVNCAVEVLNEMNMKTADILDMCTGSGCIAISLSKYINNARVIGVDISKKALEIANKNSELNNANVIFIQSDLFEKILGTKFDIIVSNPPYIPTEDIKQLQVEVQNEPIIALDGGLDGLDIYRKIVLQAKDYLNYGGYLILEIGYNQAKDIVQILQENEYTDIVIKKDLSKNDRVIICRFLKK